MLSPQEQTKLLDEAAPWLRPIILTSLLAGLRLGEVCGLKWADVDFDTGKLNIRRTVSALDKTLGTPKGEEASIDLHPELGALLRPQRGIGDTPVFQTRQGGHLHPRSIQDAFASARGVLSDQPRALRFHDLRHTCASRLVNGGLPAPWVQGYLRHANLATTLGYLHDDRNEERKAEAWAALSS